MAVASQTQPRAIVVRTAAVEGGPIAGHLAANGFDVEVAADCAEAVERARMGYPDMIVFDQRENPTSKQACVALRAFSDAYVLVVASDGDHGCDGLDNGADDFVLPTCSERELASRARAVMRRPRGRGGAGGPLLVGPISVDVGAREVMVGGDLVSLTRIEFEILVCLARHLRTVVPRAVLIEHVWGPGWFGDEHVVDVHVSNLRRKVEAGGAPRIINTVRGVGYRADPPA